MSDGRSRLHAWLHDEATRTLLLFASASALGLASVLLFVSSPSSSPTRFHVALMLCSMVVVFYLTIRSTPI